MTLLVLRPYAHGSGQEWPDPNLMAHKLTPTLEKVTTLLETASLYS